MSWSTADAARLYNVAQWGDGHFSVNNQGEVTVHQAAIHAIVDEAINKGLRLPLLIRCMDVLKARFDLQCEAFSTAMRECDFGTRYTCAYPIKANQQQTVAATLMTHDKVHFGIEVGSKPELLAALSLAVTPVKMICNGYKDREFVRLALIAQKMGHEVNIILEKMDELRIIQEEAANLNVEPTLGVRMRLHSVSRGRWQDSGGAKSKFGLSAFQVLQVVKKLEEHQTLHWLKLLHFHLGSQVANIMDIQRGVKECVRYFVELRRLGVNIDTLNVGGGLGVDYEGTHSRSAYSMNYSLQEYANNVVHTIKDVCDQYDEPYPHIITESGRALTAHHALLVMNVIDVEKATNDSADTMDMGDRDLPVIRSLINELQSLNADNAVETYHDACYWYSEAQSQFMHGVIDMNDRAHIEQLYLQTCTAVRKLLDQRKRAHREIIDTLNLRLADKVFCNFSVFQSLPDSWALNQVFPIVPLTGLDQTPTRRIAIQDLTCDSDGCIKQYVEGQDLEATLPVTDWGNHPPYIGIFLVGAYQEILGDLHNLFGDTDAVNVEINTQGEFTLVDPEIGDAVNDVLSYVHYQSDAMHKSYQQQLQHTDLSAEEQAQCMRELTAGLAGYTYLEE